MFINITMEIKRTQHDIRIDSEQKIAAGFLTLQEAGKLPKGSCPDYFRSRLKQAPVSAYKTFTDEEIYDGDILTALA